MLKSILYSIAHILCAVIICFLFVFTTEYSMGAVAGKWSFDVRDWLYELNANGALRIMVASLVFSGIVIIYFHFADFLIESLPSLFIGIIVSVVLAAVGSYYYLNYIVDNCFVEDILLTLEDNYQEFFGAIGAAQYWICAILCIIGCVRLIFLKSYLFIQMPVKKMALKHVLCKHESLDYQTVAVFPLFLIWPSVTTLVFKLRLNSIWLFVILICVMNCYFLCSKIRKWINLSRYFTDSLALNNKTIVFINGNDNFDEPIYYEKIFKNMAFMNVINTVDIIIIPGEIINVEEYNFMDYISVDIIGTNYCTNSSNSQYNLEKNNLQEKAVFHFALDLNHYLEEPDVAHYDSVATNMDQLLSMIVEVKDLLHFQEEKQLLLNTLEISNINTGNCIISELFSFEHYMRETINPFLVFDAAIKWCETINYLYSLILLQAIGITVDEARNNRSFDIHEATFGKWINFRYQVLSFKSKKLRGYCQDIETTTNYVEQYKLMIQTTISDKILEDLIFIEKAIGIDSENIKQTSKGVTIDTLLRELNRIRDYTRGHGVFTFEINDEINIAILQILVVLINNLLHFDVMPVDQTAMEHLGWVLYYEETPYFCYSYSEDRKHNQFGEYLYNSFGKGNSISIPTVLQGE